MRLKDSAIQIVALELRPRLSEVIRQRGAVSLPDIRQAIVEARRGGLAIPNLTSARSLKLVEEALVEM